MSKPKWIHRSTAIVIGTLLVSLVGLVGESRASEPAAAAACQDFDPRETISVMKNDLANSDDAMVIAHRGLYGGSTPENSLAAVQAAVSKCFPAIELDVKETKDGIPIVMHDYNVGRTTDQGEGSAQYDPMTGSGVNTKVANLNWSKLSTYKLLSTDRTSVTPESVPSVQKVYDVVDPGLLLVWDVKTKSAAQSVAAIAQKAGLTKNTLLKVNATVFPLYADYAAALSNAGVNQVPWIMPIYTSNMLNKIDVASSVKDYTKRSSDLVPAVEVNMKNTFLAKDSLLSDAYDQVRAAGRAKGIFQAIPDGPGGQQFYKNTGECCYVLSDLFVTYNGVTETVDKRGSFDFLEQNQFNVITSDAAIQLRDQLRAVGKYRDRPVSKMAVKIGEQNEIQLNEEVADRGTYITAGLTGAGVASPTSAAIARVRTCKSEAAYSPNRWQWGAFAVCVEVVPGPSADEATLKIEIDITDLQYYWGGAWYSNKYPADLTGSVIVQRDGHTVKSQTVKGHTESTSLQVRPTDVVVNAGGRYTISTQVSVRGQYWDTDQLSQVYTHPIDLDVIVAT